MQLASVLHSDPAPRIQLDDVLVAGAAVEAVHNLTLDGVRSLGKNCRLRSEAENARAADRCGDIIGNIRAAQCAEAVSRGSAIHEVALAHEICHKAVLRLSLIHI